MELSKTVGALAVVLGVAQVANYAVGEDAVPAAITKQTAQQKIDERELQRRVALDEQQKRRDHFERACSKPLKTELEMAQCRAAYKALGTPQK